MKQKNTVMPPMVGGSALLVIFAVLCLTVFALLSLHTVQAEKRLADASLEAISAYYEADSFAEELFSRIRRGELPPQVERDGSTYSYTCPVSGTQELAVTVEETDGQWQVLRWQTVSTAEFAPDDTLSLWDGDDRGGENDP